MENFSEASTEWSVCSDFYEYLSPAICRQVRNVYREAVQGARRREIVFSAGHRRVVTRIDALRRRQLLLAAFNRQESRETCLELIKYYNKNGFLNDPLQFKFINSLVKNNIKYYVNRLKFSDINNIRNNKYNRLSILIKLAAAVRNKQRLRQVRESQNIYKLRKLINKINNNYVNKFLQLDVEEGIDQAEEMYPDDEDITPSVSRRVRVQIWDDVTQFDLPRVYQETTIPERNIDLLQKLHIILWRFRNSRRRAALREEIEMQFPLQTRQRMADIQDVQPEMIEPTEIGQQQESGPVVLTALEQDRNTETTQDLDDGFWVNNSTGDAIVNQQHASSMEILTYQFNWSSSQQSNYKLFDIGLPIYAITNNPDHPAAMLFNQYAYWNGDIKIRIHINTTPFHIGKLIFSWYYAGDFDANQSHRDNIASSILLPNVCFSASKGDDVVLEIPYRNYRSMLCTRNDSATDSKPLYLGNLRCHVFNPLILGDATSVDGYIHVSFVNNKFTGISPRVVVQPEMLPTRSLIKGIEKSLNIVDKITNMDKPPNPAVPTMYTPQLTDSFASGTNDFNNIHALRLNPAGQTPHPRGSSTTVEETLVDNIIQKPGLLRILKWETSSTRGHKLMQLDVSPELNYSDYYSTIIHQNTIDYSSVVLPPVSAVSCFNAYNRGGIKYTIEVICSRYHAGALLVSFTPRARNIDLNTAVKSYNATLDIGNIQSYEFIAPYINERPYNPRFNRELSNVVLPALAPVGEFNIFVLNQLRSINDVSKTVYVNVYMSAANDFEVAVPVPPLYSVDYDYQVPIKPQTLYLDNMSSDMGVDDWRYFDKSRHLCVFKYGTGSDSVAQLVGAQPYTVYQIKPKGSLSIQDSPYSVRQWVVAQGVFSQTVNFNFTAQYFAVIIVNGDGNKYRYLAPFSSLDVARSYCIAHHSLRTAGNLYPDSPTLEQWVAYLPTQTSFYLCLNNNNEASYRAPSNTGLTNYPFVLSSVAAEMDNVILDPTIKRLPSAQKGLRLFGEQFSDLKDYCRRYQIYGSATVKTDKNTLGFRVRVPITPIGLTLDKDSNGVVHSITREGIIGYIASAFRFYRGSMRFKIIATIHAATSGERSNQHNTWYIQHKPDVMLSNRNINVLYYNSNSTPSPYNVLQSGYAYTAFSPHINNSITFETPCYIPTNLLMLQKPNFDALAETLHYTLGCFDIYGYTNLDAMTIEFTLHYALGDDMDMSCYVGFPPMIPLYSLQASDNEFVHVQPEMDEVKKKLDEDEKQSKENELATTSSEAAVDAMLAQAFSNLAQGKTSVVESHGVHLVLEPPKHMKPDKVQSEGWFDWPKKKWDEFKINYGMKEMRKKFELPPASNDTVYNLIKDLSIKFGSTYKDLIISIVSQLLHCIINSSVSTFALAIVTILTHLGLRSTTVMDKITSCFARMFSSVQGEMDDDKTEKSSEDECKQSFTMTIVSLGMSLFDKTWDFFKNMTMPDFTKGLFQNIRMGALTITAVITMFKNLVTVVPKIIQWIGRVVNPVAWYRWFVSDKKDFILKWVSDAEWATDPANLETVRSDMHYAYELELLVIVGRDISLKLNQMDKLKYDGKYISSLFARLIQVHQQVVANFHCISGVGVEPYCFRLVGGSQVGKSYCTKELMLHCLDSVGYKTHGNLIYERSKTKHFDGLSGIEPGLYYDDFLHLTTPEMASEQIAELLTLKSKCVFIPPRAELSDKGKPFNPLIVAASMNVEFPDFKNVCADPFAWMNRFDDLIRVSFKPPQGYQDKVDCSEIPHEVLQRFEHVTFQVLDRRNNAVTPGVKRVEVPDIEPTATPEQVEKAKLVTLANLNFVQLKWYLAKRFQQRMANVSKDCLRDLQLVNRFRPQKDSDFQTNLDEYIKFIRERNKQLNEQEHATIKLIESIKGLEKCSKCHNHLLLCICRYTHGVSFGQLSGPVQPEMGETYDFAAIVKKAKIDFSKYSYIDAALLRVRFFEVLAKNRDEPVRVKLWMSSFTTFINEPCIHRYVKLMKHYYFPNLEYDSCLKLFQFVTLEGEHFSLISCDSKCAVRKDPDYIDYMRKVFVSQFDEAFIPEEYKVNDPKLKEHIVEFKKRQKTAHAKFCKFLAEEVDPDTWMTKKGSLLWKICKYSLVVIGAVGVLYGVCNYKSVIKQVQKLNPYNSIKNQNVAYAKMLEEHVVTETCLNGQCQICINPQMAYDQNKKNTKPRLNITSKTIESKSIQPEMNTEFFNSLSRHLKRNYFYLFAHDGNYESVARCLGVKGRWFLAIDHYFDKFDTMSENAKFYYCDQQMYKPIDYKSIVKYKLKNSAIVMCKLPNDMPLFKNIVKRFVRSDFVHNVCPTAYLYEPVIPNSDKMVGTMDIMLHKNVLTLVDDTLCIPDINGAIDKYTTCEWYWQYQTSGKGRCGSILISDMNHNSPIVGMHVAGKPGSSGQAGSVGYGEVICQETLENVLEQLEPSMILVDIETEGQMFDGKYINIDVDKPERVKSALDGNFIFTGVVPEKFSHKPPTKSKLVHTMCYNQITNSTYDFPHISHRDSRFEGSPMVNGCLHHTDPPLSFKTDLLEVVQDDVKQQVLAKVKPIRSKVGVLTREQSICGIHEVPQYGAMEFDTSEGFPFVSIRPKTAKDKRWLFDLYETSMGYGLRSIDKRLVEVMDIKQQQREKGIVPLTIFTDCLKDAKLPAEKCHKTRIFSISPVDFTIQFRQYFYDFTIAFQEARFSIESAVGINVDSYEWNEMVRILLSNSTKFVCGDYSKFGPRLMSSVVVRFFEIICDWYEAYGDSDLTNRRVRMAMAHEIAFAQHLMLNMVYQVLCGAPSGCPITTILNNGVNMMYLRSAYLQLSRENNIGLTLESYKNNVCSIFYGDDLIMTVKEDILYWFNAPNISSFFDRYNIKFTDALKTGDINLYTTVFAPETSFLKRCIKRHAKRPVYVAAMDKRAIEETCNWTFASNDLLNSSLISCESMLLNAHGQGKEYYEMLRNKCMQYWRQFGICPSIPSWVDVDWRIYEGLKPIKRNEDFDIIGS